MGVATAAYGRGVWTAAASALLLLGASGHAGCSAGAGCAAQSTAKTATQQDEAASAREAWALDVSGTRCHGAEGLPLRVRRIRDGAVMALVVPSVHGMDHIAPFYADVTEVPQRSYDLFARETGRDPWMERRRGWLRERRAGSLRPTDAYPEWMNRAEYEVLLLDLYPRDVLPNLPACQVRQAEARAYAQWVGCDLPTEAEYGVLLCPGTHHATYPWGESLPPPAGATNARDASFARSFPTSASAIRPLIGYDDGYAARAPVGTFGPDVFGLYDVSGNVSEWCRDTFLEKYHPGWPPEEKAVARGGAWDLAPDPTLRCNDRSILDPSTYGDSIGFRCVREASTIRSGEIVRP